MINMIRRKLKRNNFIKELYNNLCYIYAKCIQSDKNFIKKYFEKHVGRKVDLHNPIEFNDKLQWLKLNWYDPFAVKCADKYEVRKIIKNKIGSKYLNELYAVYDSINEIDISQLPDMFVLKATHSSGRNFVCKNKYKVNWNKKIKEVEKWMKENYFWKYREWVYKDIKPRIICEKLLEDDNQKDGLTDYKFYCFHGEPKYCQVIKDRSAGGTIDFFDTDWNHMEFTGLQNLPNSPTPIPRPEKLEEMLDISKKLSEPFPFVRVDLYYVNKKIYFGELTFFPRSGIGSFYPPKWNKKMGDLLELPTEHIKK